MSIREKWREDYRKQREREKEKKILAPKISPEFRPDLSTSVVISERKIKQTGSGRVGYWAMHEYKRRSSLTISYFCGWAVLVNLLGKCANKMERALIATLFETGEEPVKFFR